MNHYSIKKSLSIIGLLFIVFQLSADPVNLATAKKVAQQFVQSQSNVANAKLPKLELVSTNSTIVNGQELVYYYSFKNVQGGFTIVAGDDRSYPILAYSSVGEFNGQNIPRAAQKWFEGYKKELAHLVRNEIEPTEEISKAWEDFGYDHTAASKKTVSPLLTTTWNQGGAYNDACPGGSVTGCVATAMAQVMKYHAYPTKGSGFHSYNHSNYGTLSANFSGTEYKWSSMPNNVTSTNSAVATIMYHCGVSVDMDYSPQSSGAYVISSQSPVTNCAEYAFEEYFGYPSSVKGVERVNYSESQWLSLLKTELDNDRPVLYAGFGNGGGHAFVCDGYDANDYFHFNWGWGGAYDGYFLVNALNPSGTGTGGGSGGYNSGQQVIIGLAPPTGGGTTNSDIVLYDYIEPSYSQIYYGQDFTVSTNVANNGADDFSGDFCAAAFDEDLNFVEYIEIKTGYTLQSGYTYTDGITFSTDGLLSMLPGKYSIGIFFKPSGGKWAQAGDYGSYENLIDFEVINPNDIELYSDMALTPGSTVIQGKKLAVNVNILNDGATTFKGEFQVNLYNLEGEFVQEIGSYEETDGLPYNYTYASPYLTFTSDEIEANPGTYLVAMVHKRSGSTSWEITGSSYYQNPIKVTVQTPPIQKDQYENNDEVAKAYKMALSFNAEKANTFTPGANIHVEEDVDYYKLDFESGYDYFINARVNDALSTNDNETYTLDALISYSINGVDWSDPSDDVIAEEILQKQKGTIYFKVAPYFAGDKGSYSLNIAIDRQLRVSTFAKTESVKIVSYPNPASDNLFIEVSETSEIQELKITGIDGKLIMNLSPKLIETKTPIDVSELSEGTYLILLKTKDAYITKQFIVR